jgi:hypothetical protein
MIGESVGLLGNLVLVLALAVVVRALLGAREVTWPRLLLAVLAGTLVGASVAALLIIDLTSPIDAQISVFEDRREDLYALALPFR